MHIEVRNSVVRDNIEGNRLIEAPLEVRRVVDSIEFQRLRSIKQMGLSSYAFPTAEHSRFAHSLGVYATARQVFSQLQLRAYPLQLSGPWFRFDDNSEKDFCIAALCHDIGHTAFSHVLENVLLPDGFRSHEDCTRALISGDTKVAKAIEDVADREAILLYLDKKHPNKALNDLISSPFDVDRCDYVLRDGVMAGVEYGKFDLKWLVHALRVVKAQYFGHPVLLLEGPRGIDALRQFLSARRYLYRQVYFHGSVRAAQILLKGIFERMQDCGEDATSLDLTPDCLRPILATKKPSLGQFLDTTDNEILFMIRNYARNHKDETLRFLCRLFVERQLPKCVLDSSKRNTAISREYNVSFADDDDAIVQPTLWGDADPKQMAVVSQEIQQFVSTKMGAIHGPREAARYLVSLDQVEFRSDPPADLLFAFQDETIPLEQIDSALVGFDVKGLLEQFTIDRLFVPAGLEDDVKEFMIDQYGKNRVDVPFR